MSSDSPSAEPPASKPEGPAEDAYPELVVGRGRFTTFALQRLKSSRLLQASAVLAFLSYGSITLLVLWHREGQPVLPFQQAAILVVISLASWFFLFWWFPVLERTLLHVEGTDRAWIARSLEVFAIGCVVVVHALLLVIILLSAGVIR